MTFEVDMDDRSVSVELPAALYARESVAIAAQVFGSRAQVMLAEDARTRTVTIQSTRKTASAADLETLAGDFVNEVLNQEYRQLVGRFNRKISQLVVTQSLLAARGGENPPAAPEAEKAPEFQAAVAELVREAQDEIRRTMPKKLPPQGAPLPPAKEEPGA